MVEYETGRRGRKWCSADGRIGRIGMEEGEKKRSAKELAIDSHETRTYLAPEIGDNQSVSSVHPG